MFDFQRFVDDCKSFGRELSSFDPSEACSQIYNTFNLDRLQVIESPPVPCTPVLPSCHSNFNLQLTPTTSADPTICKIGDEQHHQQPQQQHDHLHSIIPSSVILSDIDPPGNTSFIESSPTCTTDDAINPSLPSDPDKISPSFHHSIDYKQLVSISANESVLVFDKPALESSTSHTSDASDLPSIATDDNRAAISNDWPPPFVETAHDSSPFNFTASSNDETPILHPPPTDGFTIVHGVPPPPPQPPPVNMPSMSPAHLVLNPSPQPSPFSFFRRLIVIFFSIGLLRWSLFFYRSHRTSIFPPPVQTAASISNVFIDLDQSTNIQSSNVLPFPSQVLSLHQPHESNSVENNTFTHLQHQDYHLRPSSTLQVWLIQVCPLGQDTLNMLVSLGSDATEFRCTHPARPPPQPDPGSPTATSFNLSYGVLFVNNSPAHPQPSGLSSVNCKLYPSSP
jgi:hypothetical protein